MSVQPLVSICIPAYNNRDFLAATLDCVLQQTHTNLEVIVTDDYSTDGTVSVARSFTDPRITVIQNEINLGLGSNWNKAMFHATGKYIKLMGADDLIYRDCLEQQVKVLENPANARASLAVCNADVINADGRVVLKRRLRFRSGLITGKELIRDCVRWGANLIGEPVVGLFRRDVLAKSGMFDPSNPYMIDVIFWAELLKHGDAFMEPSRLAAFRISANSVSTKLGMKHAAYTRSFIRKMCADPFYNIGHLDALRGHFFALPRSIARNWVIKHWANAKCN